MAKPFLKVEDFTKKIGEAIKSLKDQETVVGIPQTEDARKKDPTDQQGIGNAGLLWINNFGSPVNNIPPRPVMAIGIKLSGIPLVEEFRKCAKAALTNPGALDLYFQRIGIIASNSIKNVINNQIGIDGPSEATLKSRESKGFRGTKSLVVTAQMRNAITYVVRPKGWK